MKILIKQAKIISSLSPFHLQVQDIAVADGIIQQIENNIPGDFDVVIHEEGLCVSLGWMDIFADFADPGFEQNETLETGAAAAAAGGFTDVMILPNTNPAGSTKTQIEYLINKAKTLSVNILPIGAVTKNAAGKELAEMYDMAQSGAVAFSDGTSPVEHAGIFSKALQYVLPVNKTIIQVPSANNFSAHGLMSEGAASTRFGLPGMPAIAEELMIGRDIEILRYTNSKLHITGISTKEGLKKIAAAKAEGLNISCSVTAQHLWFIDEDLADYDTNLKLFPPLRRAEDRDYLKKEIISGTIDCFASHHFPHHEDEKNCEFEYAEFGNTGLETLFPAINPLGIPLETIIEKLTITPREIFGLAVPKIDVNEKAVLTLFCPEKEFIYTKENAKSQSLNCAFLNKVLKGKVIGIINKNQLVLN